MVDDIIFAVSVDLLPLNFNLLAVSYVFIIQIVVVFHLRLLALLIALLVLGVGVAFLAKKVLDLVVSAIFG